MQAWVDALCRGVVMRVGGEPVKVFLDPTATCIQIPVSNVSIELDQISEIVFTISVMSGIPVPEMRVIANAHLGTTHEELSFQFENQRSRFLFALTIKVLRARQCDGPPVSIRYL